MKVTGVTEVYQKMLKTVLSSINNEKIQEVGGYIYEYKRWLGVQTELIQI